MLLTQTEVRSQELQGGVWAAGQAHASHFSRFILYPVRWAQDPLEVGREAALPCGKGNSTSHPIPSITDPRLSRDAPETNCPWAHFAQVLSHRFTVTAVIKISALGDRNSFSRSRPSLQTRPMHTLRIHTSAGFCEHKTQHGHCGCPWLPEKNSLERGEPSFF